MSESTEQSLDGTEKLCNALYARKSTASDYLGGSDSRILHQAANTISALREKLETAKSLAYHTHPITGAMEATYKELAESNSEALDSLKRQFEEILGVPKGGHIQRYAKSLCDVNELLMEILREVSDKLDYCDSDVFGFESFGPNEPLLPVAHRIIFEIQAATGVK